MPPRDDSNSLALASCDSKRDALLSAKAAEIMATDPELQEQAKSNRASAYRRALRRAASEMAPARERSSRTASAERETAINKRAEELLDSHPDLLQLRRTDRATAFKKAIRLAAEEIPAPVELPAQKETVSAHPTLTRQRRVHEVALAMLTSYPDFISLAARNYPEAFRRAHSAASDHYLVKIPRSKSAPNARDEKVHKLALTLLMEQTDLKELDRSSPGKAFDKAMGEAAIHYPMNADGTEGTPTRYARSAEIARIVGTPAPRPEHDARARAAIDLQRGRSELYSLESRIARLESEAI